ncbi:MAG: hypothetical protein JXA30_21740 [Deltaproteobacteria bacterium]|nr:hypothetical protein [Deltaproteobacteria bacterium]
MVRNNRGFSFILFFLSLFGCAVDSAAEPSRVARRQEAILSCGGDADGDGIENCAEQDDGRDWTDPEIFNGMRVSHAGRCHYAPSCDRIDDLFEVEACSKVDEEKTIYSGWDFSTSDGDLCDPGYGFKPAWSNCSEGFQIEAKGYIELTQAGYHCFEVLGEAELREECGSFFFHDQKKAIVTNGGPICFYTSAGVYPIRWFYETSAKETTHSLHVNYCYEADSPCAPSEAISSSLLRPVYYQCIPTTCALQNAECGEIDDGCGGVLDCDRQIGGCSGKQSCGGGGESNRCGCSGEDCCRQEADSDGDGVEDCSEVGDHDAWTDPVVFNGMRVSTSDVCHENPNCDELDDLAEVRACEKNDEQLLQYAGWDFTTSEHDRCNDAFGFRPGWTDCEDEFQIDARGFIKFDNNGYHCFSIASESDDPGQCAVLLVDDETEGIVIGQKKCFDYSAGIYPIRWFYEANNRAEVRSMRLRYCYGKDERCSPTDAIASSLLRPRYAGDEAICLNNPILCTALCPCDAGQGPCSDDSHCRGDLVCGEDNGQRFGADDEDDYCWSARCESDPVAAGCGAPDAPCGYCPENCINGEDDDQDGYIDCDDTECMDQIYCDPEICHNNIDDNLNGLIDCADPDCYEDLDCHCGNGIRQAHSRIVPREGCDDGNTEDGDACSSLCEPTVMVVRSENVALKAPDTVPARVGVSGDGNLLMLWLEDADDHWEIKTRRFNHGGAAIDEESEALVIDDSIGLGWPAEPSAAGLPVSGWVVVWASQSVDGDGSGIAFRIVDSDGTVSSITRANQQRNFGQMSARVATTAEGFVIAWIDEGSGADRTLIKARLFDSAGKPLGDEFRVGTAGVGDESQPEMAASGNQWMAVWTNAEDRSVRGRRYEDASALDLNEMLISYDSHSASVSAMPDTGDFALSWTGIFEGEPGPEDDLAFATYTLLLRAVETAASDSGVRAVEDSDGTPEYYSSVAALNRDVYLVAWQYGPVYRDSDFVVIDNSDGQWPGVPHEETALREALNAESSQRELEVTPTDDGVWFTWTFDGLGSEQGISNALMTYPLPGD